MTTPAGQRWTRRKPTEPGWYWFRRIDLPLHCARAAVLEVSTVKGVLSVYEDYGDGVLWHPLKQYKGEWLGPITPDAYAAGRVATCVWTYDDIDDCYNTGCGNAYCLVDGTLEENEHRYCPYCGHSIHEAPRAAQIEEGE